MHFGYSAKIFGWKNNFESLCQVLSDMTLTSDHLDLSVDSGKKPWVELEILTHKLDALLKQGSMTAIV